MSFPHAPALLPAFYPLAVSLSPPLSFAPPSTRLVSFCAARACIVCACGYAGGFRKKKKKRERSGHRSTRGSLSPKLTLALFSLLSFALCPLSRRLFFPRRAATMTDIEAPVQDFEEVAVPDAEIEAEVRPAAPCRFRAFSFFSFLARLTLARPAHRASPPSTRWTPPTSSSLASGPPT